MNQKTNASQTQSQYTLYSYARLDYHNTSALLLGDVCYLNATQIAN